MTTLRQHQQKAALANARHVTDAQRAARRKNAAKATAARRKQAKENARE